MKKLLGAAALVFVAGGCMSASPTPVASSAAPAMAQPSAAQPADAGTPEPGHTCPATGGQIPAGAHQAVTADVDYDGKPDTLWLADVGGKRLVGLQTASGAIFSTTFTGSGRVTALGQKMSAQDDPSIVVLAAGGSVKLYTVADCAIVPTTNPQRMQYSFSGTGVECPSDGAGYSLASLEVKGNTVYRTPVTLSNYGRRAKDEKQTVASGVSSKQANSITCGTGNTAVTE